MRQCIKAAGFINNTVLLLCYLFGLRFVIYYSGSVGPNYYVYPSCDKGRNRGSIMSDRRHTAALGKYKAWLSV